MSTRRFLVPSLALAAALTLASCGSVDPTTVDARRSPEPAGDQLVRPDAPPEDVADDPDANPPTEVEPDVMPVSDTPPDPAAGIEPAEGEVAPSEQVITGRVVQVDRDGPAVEIVESSIVTGTAATDAARAAGVIGPDEAWDQDFFVVEGATRWVDLDPSAAVAVYDCTQACEHVAGTLEHVLTGAPYGGAGAVWTFVLGPDGRARSVDEIYLP